MPPRKAGSQPEWSGSSQNGVDRQTSQARNHYAFSDDHTADEYSQPIPMMVTIGTAQLASACRRSTRDSEGLSLARLDEAFRQRRYQALPRNDRNRRPTM
jgi:hypothetical protein